MRNDTTTSDGSLDKGIELFVTADGELKVTWCDSFDLEIFAGVASELEHLSCEVLEDSGRIDGRCRTNTAARAHSALEESVDSANREL